MGQLTRANFFKAPPSGIIEAPRPDKSNKLVYRVLQNSGVRQKEQEKSVQVLVGPKTLVYKTNFPFRDL